MSLQYSILYSAFLHGQVDIPRAQTYAIKEGLPVAEASKEYEGQLLGIPQKVLPRDDEGGFCRPWAALQARGGNQTWD